MVAGWPKGRRKIEYDRSDTLCYHPSLFPPPQCRVQLIGMITASRPEHKEYVIIEIKRAKRDVFCKGKAISMILFEEIRCHQAKSVLAPPNSAHEIKFKIPL